MEIEPFYFESNGRRLFGAYHRPAGALRRDVALVLSYPIGQEYIRAHRAFLQLALRLSRNGYPVLRFDFSGTGDSSADLDACVLETWREDLVGAMSQLGEMSGHSRFCLCGLRLGASLAAMVAALGKGVQQVILWDPIVHGPAYLAELRDQHRQWLQGSFARSKDARQSGMSEEILGFGYPRSLIESIERLDLTRLNYAVARTLLVETQDNERLPELYRALTAAGRAEIRRLPMPPIWIKQKDVESAVVPATFLDGLVRWLHEEAA